MSDFNKKRSPVILIKHFFVLPCQTAPTKYEYFNGRILCYPLGDDILNYVKNYTSNSWRFGEYFV